MRVNPYTCRHVQTHTHIYTQAHSHTPVHLLHHIASGSFSLCKHKTLLQSAVTVCISVYICVGMYVCACKLKGNFSRKNTFSLLRFYGCLDLFLVRRWLLFHCPGEYNKRMLLLLLLLWFFGISCHAINQKIVCTLLSV